MIKGKTFNDAVKIQFLFLQIKTKQLIFKQLRCFFIVNLRKTLQFLIFRLYTTFIGTFS